MAAPTGEVQLSFPHSNVNIPSEITCKIVCLLKRSELWVMMQVCVEWRTAARHPLFWGKEIQILGLKNPTWDHMNAQLKSLLQTDAAAHPLLAIQVKTAQEFDAMMLPIYVNDAEPTEEERVIAKRYNDELNEKFELHASITNGFGASCALYQLGLRTIEHVKEYALCLENKYGQNKYWAFTANALVAHGNIDEARALTDAHVKEVEDKAKVICNIASVHLRQGSISAGFKLLMEYIKKDEKFKVCVDDCVQDLLEHANKKNDLSVIEMAIDTLVVNSWDKISKAISLIEAYHAKNDRSEVQRLLSKYELIFEGAKRHQDIQVVELYVKVRRYAEASQFALSHRETSQGLTLYTLRNALQSTEAPAEEIAKAEKLISDAE